MKRILVPTDFSNQAENALKVAAHIARKNQSEIYLEHSLDMPASVSDHSSTLPESMYFIRLAEQKFEPLLQRPYLTDINVHEAIGHGEIFDDIRTTVKEKEIDLIVMGSHGLSGFMEMFIGSNTEKVVRTSNIPVLVIKNEHSHFEIDDFVFATDCSAECVAPFTKAMQFAAELDAKMHLLYINTPNDFKTSSEANNMMASFTKGIDTTAIEFHVYNELSVEKGILGFARENQVQIIGMSTHGRKGLSHFFNGSISEDLVNHANMPVITFKI